MSGVRSLRSRIRKKRAMDDDQSGISVQHISSLSLPEGSDFDEWVTAALNHLQQAPRPLTVRLVDKAESARLNGQFRGRDTDTNVLAFSASPPAGLPMDEVELGDLVICLPRVFQEARDQGKSARDHLAHLVVHGTLHLLGYTHDAPEQADLMETAEIQVLASLGIQDPYADGAAEAEIGA